MANNTRDQDPNRAAGNTEDLRRQADEARRNGDVQRAEQLEQQIAQNTEGK